METFYTADGRKFVGMPMETVQRLMAEMGCPCTFITEEQYAALTAPKAR